MFGWFYMCMHRCDVIYEVVAWWDVMRPDRKWIKCNMQICYITSMFEYSHDIRLCTFVCNICNLCGHFVFVNVKIKHMICLDARSVVGCPWISCNYVCTAKWLIVELFREMRCDVTQCHALIGAEIMQCMWACMCLNIHVSINVIKPVMVDP